MALQESINWNWALKLDKEPRTWKCYEMERSQKEPGNKGTEMLKRWDTGGTKGGSN